MDDSADDSENTGHEKGIKSIKDQVSEHQHRQHINRPKPRKRLRAKNKDPKQKSNETRQQSPTVMIEV